MATKASIRQMRYDKAHQKQYNIKMNLVYDKDIIEKLSSVPSVMGYIKQLIRQDIAGSVPDSSVPKKESDSVPELFRDPYTDPIATAVGKWIDKATSVLSDERPYIVADSVPETEKED